MRVEPFGLGQQPVQADDFQTGGVGLAANLVALGGGDLRRILGHGERGDLDPRIAALGRKRKRLIKGPVLEGFVADGEFHGVLAVCVKPRPVVAVRVIAVQTTAASFSESGQSRFLGHSRGFAAALARLDILQFPAVGRRGSANQGFGRTVQRIAGG